MRGSASSASRRRWFVPAGRCGAFARRRADAKLVSALDASVRTSDRALREVERLKRQRQVLARHVAVFRDRAELAARIIAALERDGNTGVEAMMELRRTIQRRDEEIGHLRFESAELMATVLRYKDSIGQDTDAILQDSWELAKRLQRTTRELERVRGHRRILAGHLRSAMRACRIWQHMAGYDPDLMADARRLWNGLQHGFNAARTFVQRLFWTPIVGWRGSAEIQEALHG